MAVALIVAAGRGQRLGAELPKALVPLAGRPLVSWSIDALRQVQAIERIVVAMPSHSAQGTLESDFAVPAPPEVIAVTGGATRSESVRAALAAAGPGDPVLVHDAARPLVSAELVRRTLAALDGGAGFDAAVAAAPLADTVKRASDGVVIETLDRASLWAVQTPQVFRRDALERALGVDADVLAQATDDAWLIERGGGRVAIVPADRENLKVTSELDLQLAELLLARRPA
jgi:2-C-methyl-D-erythritol 4-phosphate cytidylyltransferase